MAGSRTERLAGRRRRRVAAGALQRSEERFRLLVDSVLDYAIYMLDTTGHIQSWNAGAERLKGYTAAEILGQHYSRFYPDEARAADLPGKLLEQARLEGRVEHAGWRVRKDGTRFWANVTLTALRDERGELTGFAKVTRDMTATHLAEEDREQALAERQVAVQRLEELDRWRREFLASVVHDLQNPVIAILGFANLLREGREVPGLSDADLAERVVANARAMQELLENLRAYGQLSEGEVELAPERIDLAEAVPDLLAALGPLLGGRPVDVDVDGVVVHADRLAFDRILRNLLGNAIRHTPEGTAVHLRAWTDDGATVVEVADEGPGITPQVADRLFDRFASGEQGGTGLGLSIVRSYLELHGGAVTVDSEPGQGATFRLTFPGPGGGVPFDRADNGIVS
jgi:PAS domain S-box-containing protein